VLLQFYARPVAHHTIFSTILAALPAHSISTATQTLKSAKLALMIAKLAVKMHSALPVGLATLE